MKRLLCLILVLSFALVFAACGKTSLTYDYDMVNFSSTMVYSQVYIIYDDYMSNVGKTVRFPVRFSYNENDDGTVDYYCVVDDSTNCCNIAFIMDFENREDTLENLPQKNAQVLVSGQFDILEENGKSYLEISHAEFQ